MKLSIIALALATSTVMAQTQPHPYALPERAPVFRVPAPAWFIQLPQDTADMIFAAATATSTDEQMAYDKARMAAERKLVEMASSRITTQTKSYRSDRGDVSIENYEQVTRKNATGELIGAQRVDSQLTFDGRTYRVYVLLRLPQGDANTVANSRAAARIQREADIRSQAAHRELERNDQRAAQQEHDSVEQLRQEVAPASTVAPVVVPAAGASAPANAVPTAAGPVRLLDVDNAEYRQRRAEALQKPGAVIGHITVR
jgi:hypothetical protein